jgi:hypothetical protein
LAVGVRNAHEVSKLNDQDDTARYRNWTDGVGMASWAVLRVGVRLGTHSTDAGDET